MCVLNKPRSDQIGTTCDGTAGMGTRATAVIALSRTALVWGSLYVLGRYVSRCWARTYARAWWYKYRRPFLAHPRVLRAACCPGVRCMQTTSLSVSCVQCGPHTHARRGALASHEKRVSVSARRRPSHKIRCTNNPFRSHPSINSTHYYSPCRPHLLTLPLLPPLLA